MRVQLNNAVASGPTNAFGEISVLPDDGANAGIRTPRGGIVIRANDFNPERVILDDVLADTPDVNTGDHFTSRVVGMLDYSFGNFKLLPTSALTACPAASRGRSQTFRPTRRSPLPRSTSKTSTPATRPRSSPRLPTSSWTTSDRPTSSASRRSRTTTGPMNNGVTDASTTWNMLVAAIQTAGGPLYEYRQIDPVNNADGGEPGGNIRVGFLFRTDREVEFIDRPGGGPMIATTVIDHPSGPRLSSSPGRIAPADPAWSTPEGVRKPLVGEFRAKGKKLFVIANHWKSKSGDQPLFGRFQPPTLVTEPQRTAEAASSRASSTTSSPADPFANVVVLGDLNDFEFSAPLTALEGGEISTR